MAGYVCGGRLILQVTLVLENLDTAFDHAPPRCEGGTNHPALVRDCGLESPSIAFCLLSSQLHMFKGKVSFERSRTKWLLKSYLAATYCLRSMQEENSSKNRRCQCTRARGTADTTAWQHKARDLGILHFRPLDQRD